MPSVHAVGIDLGTTYSAVAHLDELGISAMIRNAEGEILTPSVVLFEAAEIVVGREAKKAAAERSDAVVQSAKRDMGQAACRHPINGQPIPPEVVQACILKRLKEGIEAKLTGPWKAVITVPAYFDEQRRRSTIDAGEMAGLEVLDIVNEPTAAALAFGESLGYLDDRGAAKKSIKVLVYDLGGGTFDVTLIELRPGDIRTLATDGDVELGGLDWDRRLVDYAAQQFLQRYGIDPRSDRGAEAHLLRSAEDAKHTLSVRESASVHVACGSMSLETPVTRKQFEDLTEDLLERTSVTTREVLKAVHHDWSMIDRVLLVGGSTRMPMVSRLLQKLSGRLPDRGVHPDEAVARGAAIFAGYLMAGRGESKKPAKFSVVDVNAHSLGIEGIDFTTGRKENVLIIPRNTPLPARKRKTCVTKTADQRSVVVQVLEGESKVPAQCWPIGRAVLRNLPTGLAAGAPIEVTYEYATNGQLHVSALLESYGQQVSIDLQRENGLSTQELGRWKQLLKESAGFDAFDEMLNDALRENEVLKRQAIMQQMQAASSPAAAGAMPAMRANPSVFEHPIHGLASAAGASTVGPNQPRASAPAMAAPAAQPAPVHYPTAAGQHLTAPTQYAMPVQYATPASTSAIQTFPTGTVQPGMPQPARGGFVLDAVRPMLPAIGYFLATLIGFLAAYYVLALATPVGNALNLPLPGLRRVAPPAVEPTEPALPADQPVEEATDEPVDEAASGETPDAASDSPGDATIDPRAEGSRPSS